MKFICCGGDNGARNMYEAAIDCVEEDRILKYTLSTGKHELTYAEVLGLWADDSDFRMFFSELMQEAPFPAYRWETPSVSNTTVNRGFECVLLNTPSFARRATDADTFADYFVQDDTDRGVVAFRNLRGDATMIVPSPRGENQMYGHLAAFLRGGPRPQVDALWQVVARTVRAELGPRPVWLSTAGGGVAWLHVRLDSRPKYYGYAPYRR